MAVAFVQVEKVAVMRDAMHAMQMSALVVVVEMVSQKTMRKARRLGEYVTELESVRLR